MSQRLIVSQGTRDLDLACVDTHDSIVPVHRAFGATIRRFEREGILVQPDSNRALQARHESDVKK